MDIGLLVQQNQGLVGAVVGFLASQLVQVWRDREADRRAIAAEQRADRRALRDARIARLRHAFEPVVLAAMGFQTASSHFFFSTAGDPRETAKSIFKESMSGVNEALAQLSLEDDVQDVFDELQKVRRAFATIEFEIGARLDARGTGTGAEELKQAFTHVKDGGAAIERLVKQHLRAVETSVV